MNYMDLLSAYSEEIRLRLALILNGSSVCVNCLIAVFNLPQSTVSRHLAVLRRARLINVEKKGQNSYYTLNIEDETVGKLNSRLMNVYKEELGNKEPFATDRKKLNMQMGVCKVECRIA